MTDSNLNPNKEIEEVGEKKETVEKVVPAEQAARAAKQFKGIWGEFSKAEKIIAIGALASFIAFFLPWMSIRIVGIDSASGLNIREHTGWVYIHPLLMLISLALVYFTQGASKIVKLLMLRWQIVIGTIFTTIGITGIIIFDRIIDFVGRDLWRFGRDIDISIGIGWWLLILGAIAILAGAFMAQKEMVKK